MQYNLGKLIFLIMLKLVRISGSNYFVRTKYIDTFDKVYNIDNNDITFRKSTQRGH